MTTEELVRVAQLGFDEAQKRAGTADIVARVRRMPDGTVDVAWNRRAATQQRLRIGTMSGAHLHLSKLAGQMTKPAPKGQFFVITITAADDSDAALTIATKVKSATPV